MCAVILHLKNMAKLQMKRKRHGYLGKLDKARTATISPVVPAYEI